MQDADFKGSRDNYDFILKSGTMIDPYQGIQQKMDIAVKDGLIAHLDPHIEQSGTDKGAV